MSFPYGLLNFCTFILLLFAVDNNRPVMSDATAFVRLFNEIKSYYCDSFYDNRTLNVLSNMSFGNK